MNATNEFTEVERSVHRLIAVNDLLLAAAHAVLPYLDQAGRDILKQAIQQAQEPS